jgi:hypothetical protein
MRWQTTWLALLALIAAQAVPARTFTIDDTGTLPYDSPLILKWPQPSMGTPADNLVSGTVTVRVKLNVAPWLRHSGHIYLVLPAQQPGAMSVSWVTQGRLLPGTLNSGSRALVYSGPITTAFIEDVLQLRITLDARRLQPEQYHVNFNFEMDEQ